MRLAIVLFICLAVGACSYGQTGRSASPKIGYVDLNRVFQNYQKCIDMNDAVKKEGKAIETQLQARALDIEANEKKLGAMPLGTPDRLALADKIEIARREMQRFSERSAEEMDAKVTETISSLCAEVLSEVEVFGRERQYDFILKDQTPERKAGSRDEAVIQIAQRVVLYAKPEFDLTEAVTKRLNDKYLADKAKDVAPGAAEKRPEP